MASDPLREQLDAAFESVAEEGLPSGSFEVYELLRPIIEGSTEKMVSDFMHTKAWSAQHSFSQNDFLLLTEHLVAKTGAVAEQDNGDREKKLRRSDDVDAFVHLFRCAVAERADYSCEGKRSISVLGRARYRKSDCIRGD